MVVLEGKSEDLKIFQSGPKCWTVFLLDRPTCVVFPEPVSPTTSTTLFSLMSWMISSWRSCTGRERRKLSSSDGLLLRGTMGMPLFKRPLALFLSQLLSEGRVEEHYETLTQVDSDAYSILKCKGIVAWYEGLGWMVS